MPSDLRKSCTQSARKLNRSSPEPIRRASLQRKQMSTWNTSCSILKVKHRYSQREPTRAFIDFYWSQINDKSGRQISTYLSEYPKFFSLNGVRSPNIRYTVNHYLSYLPDVIMFDVFPDELASLQLEQQHPEVGASEVQRQEYSFLWKKKNHYLCYLAPRE